MLSDIVWARQALSVKRISRAHAPRGAEPPGEGGSGRVITWLGIHLEKLHLLVWQHGFIKTKKPLIVANFLAALAVAAVVAVARSDKTL